MISTQRGHVFRWLLFFLLVYLIVTPFLVEFRQLMILAHASLSISLCISVYSVHKIQHQRTFAMALLGPVLLLYWFGIYDIIHFSRLGSYILLSLYLALLAYSFGVQILNSRKITLNVIFATLCLYLIIGMFWGALYSILHQINPGSYSGALLENTSPAVIHTTFNYFSMVTLTTLGFGDITPQTPGAAALCQTEAIVGQFYTAVVVAWLVGNFVSEKKQGSAQ